jgi:2-iminoacetate synthase
MEEIFISEQKINRILAESEKFDVNFAYNLIEKALERKGLSLLEVAILLNHRSKETEKRIFEAAKEIKKNIYGRRIVLFAPLYIGNECINDCVYCGFRIKNKECIRKTLTEAELEKEVRSLIGAGHKRLIVVYGEHPQYSADFIKNTVDQIYAIKENHGEIRRININAAPFDVDGFAKIKSSGIGTYQIFQETYHEPTYKKLHISGPKSDYKWRLLGLDRAMEAGIDDVGIGALLGLYDWKFELLSLLAHSEHLEQKFGVGPHTISFPRIEPAYCSYFSEHPPYQIDDESFKLFVALLRLAVPYTGLILTAREPVQLRNELISLGISQIDAGSSIGVGEYSEHDEEAFKRSQFVLGDKRSLDEVIFELISQKLIPSFCTGCYRLGRTGQHFMELSKPGEIKTYCQANAILTFSEYLYDYASEKTKIAGLNLIEAELESVDCSHLQRKLKQSIEELQAGKRDLYI